MIKTNKKRSSSITDSFSPYVNKKYNSFLSSLIFLRLKTALKPGDSKDNSIIIVENDVTNEISYSDFVVVMLLSSSSLFFSILG